MQRQDVPDDAKLYVSNLPSSMTNDLLRSVFTPFGEVRPRQLEVGSSQSATQVQGVSLSSYNVGP